MLGLLTIMHPLVDACSMCVLAAGGMTWNRILLYNVVAFAMQLPLGVVLDARPRLARIAIFAGPGLVSAATLAAATGLGGWGVLCAVCFGNALFHLAAGKHVLEVHGGRSGPIGLFISTGALGLLAGRLGAERWAALCLPAFALTLLAATCVAMISHGRGVAAEDAETAPAAFPDVGGIADIAVLAVLFALVAWRSGVGLEASRLTSAAGTTLLFAGTVATLCGKIAGGYVAERFGRWKVTVASVCGSAFLAFAASPHAAVLWLVLLFVAQLATGPVLSLVHDRLCRRGGTAFGFNCLGLFAGSF